MFVDILSVIFASLFLWNDWVEMNPNHIQCIWTPLQCNIYSRHWHRGKDELWLIDLPNGIKCARPVYWVEIECYCEEESEVFDVGSCPKFSSKFSVSSENLSVCLDCAICDGSLPKTRPEIPPTQIFQDNNFHERETFAGALLFQDSINRWNQLNSQLQLYSNTQKSPKDQMLRGKDERKGWGNGYNVYTYFLAARFFPSMWVTLEMGGGTLLSSVEHAQCWLYNGPEAEDDEWCNIETALTRSCLRTTSSTQPPNEEGRNIFASTFLNFWQVQAP